MRNFKEIQRILGNAPDIKKIYLIGCTGAGKTSLVQHIIDTKSFSFPSTSYRRTTVAPTEYVIKKNIPYKTTIILKKEQDIRSAIEELVCSAILKARHDVDALEDILQELEQSPDERFKLNQMVSNAVFIQVINNLISVIITVANLNVDDESFLNEAHIKLLISSTVDKFISEIETVFRDACDDEYQLFSDEKVEVKGVADKKLFIEKNKKLLSYDFGSISMLAEYVRIEGDLLADWLDKDLEFLLIDGEGIGHSLGEKRDTLSARHYDFFNYCNSIVLVDDASNPFASGGHGAIEGIFLNGYQKKFSLVFSKTDKLEQLDQSAYFRRCLKNLKSALEKEKVDFNVENKDSYKLSSLDKKINEESKKSVLSLLKSIDEAKEENAVALEYDFSELLSSFNRDHIVEDVESRINFEHWAVVKALSKRLYFKDIEYRSLKPVSWLLIYIMRDINLFLKRPDDLTSEVFDSQNKIKQNFSNEIIRYIYDNFIFNNDFLWQQAYEVSGKGSHQIRKNFMFEKILAKFLPRKDNVEAFSKFKLDIKKLLLKSGASEVKKAIKTVITHVSIKKIYGYKNVEWSLGKDTSILIGKNGSGKSTILKLIYACINNDIEFLDSCGSPYVELTLVKTFESGETQEAKISSSKTMSDINAVLVNTFDIKYEANIRDEESIVDLDSQLRRLVSAFGEYQRSLSHIVTRNVGLKQRNRDELLLTVGKPGVDNQELFQTLQKISTEINESIAEINRPVIEFERLVNGYFSSTNKTLIVDHEDAPLLVEVSCKGVSHHIDIMNLSSGEKQLLIIFLTVVLQKEKSFILMMDEPETSLHVEWQSTFIDNIKAINSEAQIIIATHNPLILLNRSSEEVGIIELGEDLVQKKSTGTQYLDISSILLSYFQLPSLIGTQMQRDIDSFTELKLKEILNEAEHSELVRLGAVLESSLAGDVIYNSKYFEFLKFLKSNKNIEFEEYKKATKEEMQQFLSDFGGTFND